MTSSSYPPSSGRFLISEPFMTDKNFQRSVVLLVEHSEEGSLGFVLNRQLDIGLNNLIEELPYFDAPVFMGGPVEQNTLHYIHRLGDEIPNSQKIGMDLFWGGEFNWVKNQIQNELLSPLDILFFVGYSGWGPGQLLKEIEDKAWIVAPEQESFVFQKDYTDLWRQILQSMGPKYQIISNYPIDPRLN